MLSNSVLKDEGMRFLVEKLGIVEAERFIVLLKQDTFDYTKWRQDLNKDVPLDVFLADAQRYRESLE